ncbi:MAG: phospholipase D-like domain-containing protein [Acidimicrobiia bacterium]
MSLEASTNLRAAIESSIGEPFIAGNSIKSMRNGVEIFPEMLRAIEAATRSIDFVTFVYWTGGIARAFAHALAERARDGVKVRVILDGFGSRPMDDGLIDSMTSAGVQVERFRPVIRLKFWENDHRTHRKILIVDESIGFTGGVGIAEEWEGDAREPSEWRDTHFRIEGPAVLGLRAAFLTDWRDCGHVLDAADVTIPIPEPVGDVELAVLDGSAQIGFNNVERAYEALIAVATDRILIQTPYFNPVDGLSDLLVAAVNRGVEVAILIPGPYVDKRVSLIPAEDAFLPLIEARVQVWVYQPTMMHAKALLIDGQMSLVGSVNFNRRSVEKDEEVAVAVADATLTQKLEKDFREDVKQSKPVEANTRRPLRRKIASFVLRPLNREF